MRVRLADSRRPRSVEYGCRPQCTMPPEESDAFVAALLAVVLRPIFWVAFILAAFMLLAGEPMNLPEQ